MSRFVRLVVVLCWLLLLCQPVVPAAAGPPKTPAALLRRLTRELGPTKAANDRWFVLLLREETRTRISVRYIKVRTRQSAAQELLNFATAPTATVKGFAFRSFPGTEAGEAEATMFQASQIVAGLNAVMLLKLSGLAY